MRLYDICVFILSVVSLAYASAVRSVDTPKSNNKVAGAVYFITNEPSGNHVVVLALDQWGKATFSSAVSTGGKGLHANSTGPDGLYTQDAVNMWGNYLFAVNPGSNTVSMFEVDVKNPVNIWMIGTPTPSGGDFPNSIAVNPRIPQVCVLNGGPKNGIMCFTPDKKKGLVPMADSFRSLALMETSPPSGPLGTVSDVAFSHDGYHLMATVKGHGTASTPGFLAVYDVDKWGTLSRVAVKNIGGAGPFSVTLIPGKQAAFVTDVGIGFEIFDFSGGYDKVTAPMFTAIPGQMATCWSEYSYQTGNFYVDDVATSIIHEVHVDSHLNATIVKAYQMPATAATLDMHIATIGYNDYLYVMEPNMTSVAVMHLSAPGKANVIQQLNLAPAAKGSFALSFNMQGLAGFVTQW